jgi:hypothetical protein
VHRSRHPRGRCVLSAEDQDANLRRCGGPKRGGDLLLRASVDETTRAALLGIGTEALDDGGDDLGRARRTRWEVRPSREPAGK